MIDLKTIVCKGTRSKASLIDIVSS